MGLIVWIVIFVKNINDLLHYMDDTFSYEMDLTLEYYAPYKTHYSKKQVALLHLWDELDLPHNIKKQEFRPSLMIIGFHIDPSCMSMTISHAAREELANWALNIFPLLRLTLQSSYSKIAGKTLCNAGIFLNRAVIRDLAWFADRMCHMHSLYFFVDEEWEFTQVNLIILCNASTVGLGFYIPAKALSFASSIPTNPLISNILFYEALMVASTIAWATALPTPLRWLLIYTDSLDMDNIFLCMVITSSCSS
ncbi:hypothetical protein M422DRAFT_271066 [Sphaerobolus stellatus SS14]|uniref:Uncharacterized protein n=1 Tax=Sphaerobolus stellatus (strain SS14) TaxID=990650 RepID=A0A0C9UQY2_SPHS4|nr:hypothetical protein M422DRAFT_271066 [Sphaerobolus stellatus SS14]